MEEDSAPLDQKPLQIFHSYFIIEAKILGRGEDYYLT